MRIFLSVVEYKYYYIVCFKKRPLRRNRFPHRRISAINEPTYPAGMNPPSGRPEAETAKKILYNPSW